MSYAEELKETVVKKALTGKQNQEEIAREFGVEGSTVQNWLRQYQTSGDVTPQRHERRPQEWSSEERLRALVETEALQEQRQDSRAAPANRLSAAEREQIKALMPSPAYRDLSPHQIVPRLADQGQYLKVIGLDKGAEAYSPPCSAAVSNGRSTSST